MCFKKTMLSVVSVTVLVLGTVIGCQMFESPQSTPTTPAVGGESTTLSNYAQMPEGSVVVDGQQVNWVVSAWGSFPYGAWMYLEVNQQDGPGKQPGDGQIPVTLGDVVLSVTGLPAAVTQIELGLKAVHDDADQTMLERGVFPVVNGSVSMPVAYGDLVAFFGVTHYSLWFRAYGKNGTGVACGRLELSGTMPNGQRVTFSKEVCFGTNPTPPPSPTCRPLGDPCSSGMDCCSGYCSAGVCWLK